VFPVFPKWRREHLWLHHMDYLCILQTIIYLFNVFKVFSDFVFILFIFTDIDTPIFWLFIVLADCTITIGFYLYLHNTLISHRITLYCIPSTFMRLCITSIWLWLHSPSFLDLILCTSWYTSFYCVLLIIHCFSSCFINFIPTSLNLLIHTSDYIYGPTTSLISIIWSLSSWISTLLLPHFITLAT